MPMAPDSDWSKSPWGRLPSSLPPVKQQLPERERDMDMTNYLKILNKKNKKRTRNLTKTVKPAPCEVLHATLLLRSSLI